MGARRRPSNTWQDLFWPVVLRAPTRREFWQKFGSVKRTLGGQMESLWHGPHSDKFISGLSYIMVEFDQILDKTEEWIVSGLYLLPSSCGKFGLFWRYPQQSKMAAVRRTWSRPDSWHPLVSIRKAQWKCQTLTQRLCKIMSEFGNISMLSFKAKILNIISILSMYPTSLL